MSQQELRRLHVIRSACEGQLTVRQAAERLQLSERRIKQLKKSFRNTGVTAVIHGNANTPSPKALPKALKDQVLEIARLPALALANFRHLHEIITMRYGLKLSYSSLYRLLSKEKRSSPKKRRKRKKQHPIRARKAAEGMLLQADATPFAWFGNGTRYNLHGFIDDATGKITGLYLCKNECLLGYLEVLRQTLTSFGIPQSLYPDQYSVFFVNPKKELDLSVEEQLAGREKKLTQFGRIVERLGIEMFPAHSPQAKGRVERLWETLQSRLPVEFALRGITSCEAANAFLPEYIRQFNAQFSVPPEERFSAFVPVPNLFDLNRLLCVEYHRKLSSGSTISLNGLSFFIEQKYFPAKTDVTLLLSEKHGLRALINGAFYPIRLLNQTGGKARLDRNPEVVLELIERYLCADAKAS